MTKKQPNNAGVKALIRIVEEIRELYPRMEISQLSVLLHILNKPGTTAADLVRATGLSKSALSRAVRTLGSTAFTHDGDGSRREHGLNLITQVPDVTDTRSNIIAPTRLGRNLGDRIDEIIGEANGPTTG
ncbi:MarR family transcriptional regulator [Shinella sp. PSBB067]|uniref:MarR family winged helix-turn-helix transcriptional regulator n=1 Tax=Shinella sp. PSBB067 TaxID=2715959 RepID=UPI00193BA877|nr:MarR family transcriptional regulator [Shinella sp. PSBB067]